MLIIYIAPFQAQVAEAVERTDPQENQLSREASKRKVMSLQIVGLLKGINTDTKREKHIIWKFESDRLYLYKITEVDAVTSFYLQSGVLPEPLDTITKPEQCI